MPGNLLKAEYARVGGPQLLTMQSLADNWIVPTLDSSGDLQAFTAGGLVSFLWHGLVWLRDDTDTTSAHDGLTVVVTLDSVRFKSTAVRGPAENIWAVIAFQTAPPATAARGDAYGVGAAPTGAWSANANAIAICLVGGNTAQQIWAFSPVSPGRMAFVTSTNIYRSVTASNAWVDGFNSPFAANSLLPEAFAVSRYVIQGQVTAPPGSPTTGTYWLIIAPATGAFSGKEGQIAKWSGAAWVYYVGHEGDNLWDASLHTELTYSSSVWTTLGQAKILAYPTRLVRTSTTTGSGTVVSFPTAPASTSGAIVFPEGTNNVPTYALAKASNRLLIRLKLHFSGAAVAATIGIFVDAEINAQAGNYATLAISGQDMRVIEFEVAPGDIVAHNYNVRAYGGNDIQRAELQFIEIQT